MDILVTGATGYIGRAVVERLVQRGDAVRALVRSGTDKSLLNGLDVKFCEGDITDRGSLARAARGVEAVIHAAAWVSLHSRRLHDMRAVNVTAVENVASVALEVGARRLVHVSSIVAVGARADGLPVTEDHPWPFERCKVPYITTKREGEQAAFRFARMGMDVVVANPCLVVGAPDPRPSDPGNILPFLKRQLPIVIDGGANYVDVMDVADGVLAVLERGKTGERYILGGEDLSFAEYYRLLEELSGVPAPTVRVPHGLLTVMAMGFDQVERLTGLQMPTTPQMMWMARWRWFADSSRARNELRWSPGPVRDSLARAIDWYRARGLGP